ncbi:MAG: ABC transporter substrate-binding protein [Xanthobacteraceae bacterium]
MRRREFVMLFGGAAVWPLSLNAQQAGKVWRIGMLELSALPLNRANVDAFREGLRELGYVEGQNLIIEYRSAEGRTELFTTLAAELVRLKVDLIVTRGTPAALSAKQVTSAIPVVMAASGEPVGTGVVAGLARPGGNVTGLSAFTVELTSKRLEVLSEAVVGIKRIAFLHNRNNPAASRQWKELQRAAHSLGVAPQFFDVHKPDDLEPAFDAASEQRSDAFIVANDTVTLANPRQVVELAVKHRVPAMYNARDFVDAGGLMALAVSFPDLYRRAAAFVGKIIKGAKPADLPVEQPTKFELVINLKAAKAIGLEIPPTLLARADEVIE